MTILRDADDGDAPQLENFDIGDATTPWLAEVAEIVSGLLEWRADPDHEPLDRQVVVLEEHGRVLAVAAHERVVHERSGPDHRHRYVMVAAVRTEKQRGGLARLLIESILTEMQEHGVETVRWLVHPRNAASIAFNRRTFPEADKTQPPEDAPYIAFTVTLNGRNSARVDEPAADSAEVRAQRDGFSVGLASNMRVRTTTRSAEPHHYLSAVLLTAIGAGQGAIHGIDSQTAKTR